MRSAAALRLDWISRTIGLLVGSAAWRATCSRLVTPPPPQDGAAFTARAVMLLVAAGDAALVDVAHRSSTG